MHVLTIQGSPTQARKLKRGQAVRIKRGSGFNLVVSPNTYHLASRAFDKGKGVTVKLSQPEIDANRSFNPEDEESVEALHGEMTGRGLFSSLGKVFKPIGQVLKPVLKPLAKAGLGKVFDVAGSMLGNVPGIGMIAKPLLGELQKGIEGKVDGMGLYAGRGYKGLFTPVGGASGGRIRKASLMDFPEVRQAVERTKQQAGSNFTGPIDLRTSTLGYAKANADRSAMAKEAIDSRKQANPIPSYSDEPFSPKSRGYGMRSYTPQPYHRSIIGNGGGQLNYMPPALISQPFSANYQMQHFLPVQFQSFNRSMHEPAHRMGMGLYM
jgi:hypothetical protein